MLIYNYNFMRQWKANLSQNYYWQANVLPNVKQESERHGLGTKLLSIQYSHFRMQVLSRF